MIIAMNDNEWKGCTRKVSYRSKLEAEVYGLHYYQHLNRFNTYKCRVCGEFHVTTVRKCQHKNLI